MIKAEDILSLEYLKMTEFTGSHQGMRYRMECISKEDKKRLLVHVWPEPFNFVTAPKAKKQHEEFEFTNDGIKDALIWMNDRLAQWS